MKEIVIDTDIGTDVDDAFALAYALKNPDVDVKEITCVLGDTFVRAKIAEKICRMLGKEVPIRAGEMGNAEMMHRFWTGIERMALTEADLETPFNNPRFPEYSQDTKLVCIGPLTNIARQLRENPSIRNVQDVYVMGSHDGSHNFEVDLEAARIVLNKNWRKFLITKDVSQKIAFTRQELEAFRGSELGDFLYDSAIRYLDYTKKEKPRMYDVLTVSAAIGEDFVKFEERDGRFVSYDVDTRLRDSLLEVIRR